ncbi:hypothetical protein ACFFRR_008747 [Megaselia abdita]
MKSYQIPLLSKFRTKLARTSTTLKLEGFMNKHSVQQSEFKPYSTDEILSSRPAPVSIPDKFRLNSSEENEEVDIPEYKSSFVDYPSTERTLPVNPTTTFTFEGDMDIERRISEPIPIPGAYSNHNYDKFERDLAANIGQQRCHLKLQGEMNYVPEYRSQFVPQLGERAHSIPQLSSIKFHGDFAGVPEYRDRFKVYDCYSKSAPIKKPDHLTSCGGIKMNPEYQEKFVPHPLKCRSTAMKTEDTLRPKGEFPKQVPEYHANFKDPHINQMPERGKPREPYLRLKGKIEFTPEYKSTYLDHPRSRPIVKKATSSIRIAQGRSPYSSPRRKFKSSSPKRIDFDPTIPLKKQPEYRKAAFNYQIRERTPTRKITDYSLGMEKKPLATCNRRRNDSIEINPNEQKKSTNFENIGMNNKAAKFGRRASISRNAENRGKASIVEGNPKYNGTKYNPSFVVLENRKKPWF